MMIVAHLDLTEGGRVELLDGFAESAKVLIHSDAALSPIQVGLDAIAKCRLIAEGHAISIEIKPAVTALPANFYTYELNASGGVVRNDGKEYRAAAARWSADAVEQVREHAFLEEVARG